MGARIDGYGGNVNAGGALVLNGAVRTKKPDSHSTSKVSSRKKNVIKKKLNYNYREISAQILRARKAQSAAAALTRARGKVASLQSCSVSEQYDKAEVAKALAHARRMVSCARLKVSHMKEEQSKEHMITKKVKKDASHTMQSGRKMQMRRELKKREREIEQEKKQIKEQQRTYCEWKRIKKKHRNEEQEKILEANMKYLAGKDETASQYIPNASSGAAILQLSKEAKEAARELQDEIDKAGCGDEEYTGAESSGAGSMGSNAQMDSEAFLADTSAVSPAVFVEASL